MFFNDFPVEYHVEEMTERCTIDTIVKYLDCACYLLDLPKRYTAFG